MTTQSRLGVTFLYHVTHKDHVAAILARGLTPSYDYYLDDTVVNTVTHENLPRAVLIVERSTDVERENLAIIAISAPRVLFTRRKPDAVAVEGQEWLEGFFWYTTTDDIPPACVRLYDLEPAQLEY
ncbi:MAG: hypothetical protein Q8R28_15315 [Dehalococcoidia bacterium]|nr:hypothetical protein [Dehalococcoidia bacterium]